MWIQSDGDELFVLTKKKIVFTETELNLPMDIAKMLTPRQQQVLELALQGKSCKEIAAALHMSVRTVKWHISALLELTNSDTRAEMAYKLNCAEKESATA